jgi:hypothetical protein
MKRDMDLIRKLMLKLESLSGKHRLLGEDDKLFSDLEATPAEIKYHLGLISQNGLIDGAAHPTGVVLVRGLTWKGHDFIDSVRSDDVWSKTQSAAEKFGGGTIDLIIEVAKSIVKDQIKKHTGLDI